jgi:hypothetical protein
MAHIPIERERNKVAPRPNVYSVVVLHEGRGRFFIGNRHVWQEIAEVRKDD